MGNSLADYCHNDRVFWCCPGHNRPESDRNRMVRNPTRTKSMATEIMGRFIRYYSHNVSTHSCNVNTLWLGCLRDLSNFFPNRSSNTLFMLNMIYDTKKIFFFSFQTQVKKSVNIPPGRSAVRECLIEKTIGDTHNDKMCLYCDSSSINYILSTDQSETCFY